MIFREYLRGDFKLNSKSYKSSIVTIFLAVLILSSFTIGLMSYFTSFRNLIARHTGGYHFRIISSISSEDANSLLANRYIKKLGFLYNESLPDAFGSKSESLLIRMDENALGTIESWILDGDMPEAGQLLISNYMAKEINKSPGDSLELAGSIYPIAGTYKDPGYDYESHYSIFLNMEQESLLSSGQELSPIFWFKNVFSSYKISGEIMEDLDTKNISYNYNIPYLNRSFVFDPDNDSIAEHGFQILAIALFFIILALFYFIITNLFLVQESKSIMEYGRLKALGARDRDIEELIRRKHLYLSQLPIILAMVSSTFIVRLLFLVIYRVEEYFGGASPYAITKNLSLDLNPLIFIAIYILSLVIIYLGSRKPIRVLKKISILDSLKGNIPGKGYRKYDLKYRGNIERDLSQQFYKNSRRKFLFTKISLKLGFLLMAFIMTAISYYSLEKEENSIDKFTSYNIQAEYANNKELDRHLIDDIKGLDLEEIVNFRKEFVYLDLDFSQLEDEYKRLYLPKLEEDIKSLDGLKLEIFGIDDGKFNSLVEERGFRPEDFKNGRALLLNRMGKDFNRPKSRMEYSKFFKDELDEVSLSEYGNLLESRGYEFSINIENKIDSPLFDYPLRDNALTIYLPKSSYIELFNKFMRIADLDQFEYIALKTNREAEVFDQVQDLSSNYFKEGDFSIISKLEEDKSLRKAKALGNVMAFFFSIFFVIVGFSNSYFALYNLFLDRKDSLLLYRSLGMDSHLLQGILRREKNKILVGFLASMPILLMILVLFIARTSRIFSFLDILKNINYLFIIAYMAIIYIAISRMYRAYERKLSR